MNIGQLLEEIDPHLQMGVNRCCFRGQAQSWSLQPKAYRKEFTGPTGEHVRLADSRLQQWQAEALPYLREDQLVPRSEWEWLAVAQHYGLATRLVDWTSNPLVALFFAVIDHEDRDGELVVWSFDTAQYNPGAPPSQAASVVVFRPPPIFSRLKFQQGMLSYHPTPASLIPAADLRHIVIPSASKQKLQRQLHRAGIHHESIFVGLDHLAQKINWLSLKHVQCGA